MLVPSRHRATAVASALLFLLVFPPLAGAVFPGVNGQIAFVSGRPADDGQADVYVIGGPTEVAGAPLTTLPGQHRHPNWAPDASEIAYALHNGATDHDIWVHDADSPASSRLTVSPLVTEDHPTYSPDGTKIAFESEVTDGSNQRDILIMNADGSGTPVNLTNTATAVESTPVWSPDGTTIYYARKANNAATDFDIYLEPADNSSAIPLFLIDASSAAPEWQPEISPDGQRICFTHGDFGAAAADIVVARVDGAGDPVEISATDDMTPVADYNCAWSPDGQTVAYVNGAFSAGQLMFAPADDSGPIVGYVDNFPGRFDGNPDWVRDQHRCNGRLVTILGSPFDEFKQGTPGNDVVVLRGGDDVFKAKGGKDHVCGGRGDDTLIGAGQNDKLFGQQGADRLDGGKAKDLCDGGPGKDRAVRCERRRSAG